MKLIYAFRGRTFYPFHQARAFPVNLPPPEVRAGWLRKVREFGFEGLEVGLEDLVGRSDAEVDDLGRELRDAGLPCLGIRGGGGLHTPRVGSRNRALLERGVDLAARIGAGVLNTLTNAPIAPELPGFGNGELVSQNSSRDASESDYRINAEGIAAAADRAADQGVSISIEVHQNTICDNSWSTIHLLELIDRPNVGANPDLGNVYWTYETAEESCEEAILALAPHANYWHMKNLIRVPLPGMQRAVFLRRPIPDGEINYRFAVAAMLAAGYDGCFAVEGMIAGDQLTDDARSLERVRSLIAEVQADR
jgi:sugar phosphate isomerase/epimerase